MYFAVVEFPSFFIQWLRGSFARIEKRRLRFDFVCPRDKFFGVIRDHAYLNDIDSPFAEAFKFCAQQKQDGWAAVDEFRRYITQAEVEGRVKWLAELPTVNPSEWFDEYKERENISVLRSMASGLHLLGTETILDRIANRLEQEHLHYTVFWTKPIVVSWPNTEKPKAYSPSDFYSEEPSKP